MNTSHKSVIRTPFRLLLIALSSVLVGYGCSAPMKLDNDIPAVRLNITECAQMELQQAISSMSFSNARIRSNAFTKKYTLLVEKRVLEGSDLDVPTVYYLFKNGIHCVLENGKTKNRTVLKNTNCIAL